MRLLLLLLGTERSKDDRRNYADVKYGPTIVGFWRALGRDRRGTSAIEFALILPIFAALLAGTVETGHVFLVQAELTATAHDAVRRLATDVMSESETTSFVREQMAGIPEDAITVTVTSTDLASGRTDLTVSVSVPVAQVALLDLDHLIPNDTTLDVAATMVKE